MNMLSGSLVPLFDGKGGELLEAANSRVFDASGLRSSLRQDLLRLFNMRNGLSVEQFLAGSPTEFHYGLPDTLVLSPESKADLKRLELVITRAIALYEPRMTRVRVQSACDPHQPWLARMSIVALAALNRKLCEVHFDLAVDGHTACVSVRERHA